MHHGISPDPSLLFPRMVVGCDHGGVQLKRHLLAFAAADPVLGAIRWIDIGTDGDARVDYPDYAQKATTLIEEGTVDGGLLICSSGIGMSIAANRVGGVRAILCNDGPTAAALGRRHNDGNVLCLGQRLVGVAVGEACLMAFCTTPFDGGDRHIRRLGKIRGGSPHL